MHKLILPIMLSCLLAGFNSFGQSTREKDNAAGVPPALAAKYKQFEVLGEATGDLDRDGTAERVVVYNTDRETEDGYIRELHIYKQKNGRWEVWQTSESAVLKSEQGGMMGEPFEVVEIKNGALRVYHSGGSSWKWSEIQKYRFQNGAFYLIGVSSYYGKPCEYFSSFDYNLSTGKVKYKKEYEECRGDGEQLISRVEEEDFTHKPAELPTLTNVTFGDNKIVSPKLKAELYY